MKETWFKSANLTIFVDFVAIAGSRKKIQRNFEKIGDKRVPHKELDVTEYISARIKVGRVQMPYKSNNI